MINSNYSIWFLKLMYVVWYYWLLLDVIDWHWLINGRYLYDIVNIVCMVIIGCPWLLWLLHVGLMHLGWCILDDVLWSLSSAWWILVDVFWLCISINVFQLMYVGWMYSDWCIMIIVSFLMNPGWCILIVYFD